MSRERIVLTIIGVGGIAAMVIGFVGRDATPGDWRSYVFSYPRAWIFVIGLLPSVARLIPSERTRAFIDGLIFAVHRKLYMFAGTRGVILVSMLATYTLTIVLAYPYVGSETAITATWLPDFGIIFWFAAQVSLFCQETVRHQQYQADGAVDTRNLWSHFFEGYGTCRLVLSARGRHSTPNLGESGSNVLRMVKQRQQVLLEMTGSPGKVRAITTQRLTEDTEYSNVTGVLDLAHPTIVVGGPVSNPATAAFLHHLSTELKAQDGLGAPVWKVAGENNHGLAFVKTKAHEWEQGLYLNDKPLLTKSPDTSCGLVYVTRRNGHPLCVIAGLDAGATINIADNILRKVKPCLMEWACNQTESAVTEVWMMIQAGHVSVEKERYYSRTCSE